MLSDDGNYTYYSFVCIEFVYIYFAHHVCYVGTFLRPFILFVPIFLPFASLNFLLFLPNPTYTLFYKICKYFLEMRDKVGRGGGEIRYESKLIGTLNFKHRIIKLKMEGDWVVNLNFVLINLYTIINRSNSLFILYKRLSEQFKLILLI